MQRTITISTPSGEVQVAGAILAGGGATRMGGRPKSFLEVGGRRIIDRQLEVLRPLFEELWISANDGPRYAPFGLPIVSDEVRGAGPLGGLIAVLESAAAPRVMVVACDMPYLTEAAVRLCAGAPDADVVVPVVGGRPEPLFARYSRRCAAAIRARLEAGERKMTAFHADVEVRVIGEDELRRLDPELRFLANCNAPEDLL
jgi:molybdopterin-guanine dinucleotide biosynthesis protein A